MDDALKKLDAEIDALDGDFSVWLGRPGHGPVYARDVDRPHYPASTMKIGVMAAAFRLADAGELDLDRQVPVHNHFTSAVGGHFTMDPDYDSDPQVWQYQGATASLRWLVRRMIVRSSNLATNLVLEQVGYTAAQDAYRVCGATNSMTRRGIEDAAARDAGVDNEVTAKDLALQLSAMHDHTLASPQSCKEMLAILTAQELNTDFARGLPENVDVALKNGWIVGIRHSAAVIYPHDAPAFVLSACASSPLADSEDGDDEVCRLYGRLARAAWDARHTLA